MVEALAQGLGMSAEVIKAFDEDCEAIREILQALQEKMTSLSSPGQTPSIVPKYMQV